MNYEKEKSVVLEGSMLYMRKTGSLLYLLCDFGHMNVSL